jgi:acyl-CoA synthetase (AMP-forming)/AMP-acid ligase II
MTSAFLPDWVAGHAERTPDAPALATPQVRLTYGDLAQRVRDLAGHLADRGVSGGDRVIVALPTSPAAAVAALAVQALGACAVEIDRGTGSAGFATVLRQVRPRFAILAAQDAQHWRSAAEAAELAWIWTLGPARGGATVPARGTTALLADGVLPPEARGLEPPPRTAVSEDAPALVLFTSGSTGTPRGVVQTFRNLAANSRSIVEYLGLGPSDRAMLILPFHYCYGRSVLQTHLYAGGSVFLDPRFMYPRVVMEATGSEGCTGFAGVPMTFEILRREVDLSAIPMPRLRYVTQAGGPMRPETIRWARQAFAPARLFVMYGQTEATARLAYLPPDRGEDKLGSIGIPIPGVQLSVVDEAGRELPAGEVGHLVARGENVTPGYLEAPEDTAAILREGWLWTGDLARRDEEGFLFLVGRAKEMLKIGGHRVSPIEIEVVLAEHPAVAETAVVGAPDAIQGEVAVAFVVLRPGVAAEANGLRRFCRERLPASKVPSHVQIVEAMPRNASGKPLKAELAARARAALHEGGTR